MVCDMSIVKSTLLISASLLGFNASAQFINDARLALTVIQADAALRGEILKASTAKTAVATGIEQYSQQQIFNVKSVEMSAAFRQASTTCQTIASQKEIFDGEIENRKRITLSQQIFLSGLTKNNGSTAYVDASFTESSSKFCSDAESDAKICRTPSAAKYSDFTGADQNAYYLFQGNDGSATHSGDVQKQAVERYIKRVVAGTPPENLRGAENSKTVQARTYVASLRRYEAILSMAALSLNSIKERHTALK